MSVDGNLTLHCGVCARPVATINWLFNQSPLIHTGSTLDVEQITREQFGSYTCLASNTILGQEYTSIFTTEVYPHGPPFPPSNLRVVDTTSFSVELEWTAEFDGGLPDMTFVVSYRESGEGDFAIYDSSLYPGSTEGHLLSTVIQGLENNTLYDVRVASHNGFGGGQGTTSTYADVMGYTYGRSVFFMIALINFVYLFF